jgi:hypothetical protein
MDAGRPITLSAVNGKSSVSITPLKAMILAAGAARRALCLVLRYAAYGAAFNTLYEIDPEWAGVDCKDLIGLYELLLSADPSGMEGRPGSADAVTAMHRPS